MQTAISNRNGSGIKTAQKQGVHSFWVSKRRCRRASGGFSLIEILVAISVIILLLGIGFVGTSQFIRATKIKQVEAMMQGLVGANEEFKAKRQQGNVNHGGDNPVRYPAGLNSSERFVYACRQIKDVEAQMLAAVNSGESSERSAYQDRDGDGVEELYDVWGTPIVYRHWNNGQTNNQNENPDDGQLRNTRGQSVSISNADLPDSQSPFFVSAGPDGEFGTEDDINSFVK